MDVAPAGQGDQEGDQVILLLDIGPLGPLDLLGPLDPLGSQTLSLSLSKAYLWEEVQEGQEGQGSRYREDEPLAGDGNVEPLAEARSGRRPTGEAACSSPFPPFIHSANWSLQTTCRQTFGLIPPAPMAIGAT